MAPRLRSLRSPLAILDTRTGTALAPVTSETERKRRLDQTRSTARQRGYDRDWERLRDAIVIERGCRCALCGTVVVLRKREATALTPVAEVDHITSIQEAPELRLERSNLRVLCRPCHSARTARDQGFARG
ncbi:HNH endonuclease [Azospirillum agricola]|uniref:HNH endonuclease n=1 Tax=Azospirillum agricola TaxID=1720247 RepID=UPI000A0F0F78|nr:HNH endonuclease signature motif containing protein [Azospirillum agricola]SMH30593.1 5-methylcytosine-specific restriction enzyme A [Azospirillum lipoferum]